MFRLLRTIASLSCCELIMMQMNLREYKAVCKRFVFLMLKEYLSAGKANLNVDFYFQTSPYAIFDKLTIFFKPRKPVQEVILKGQNVKGQPNEQKLQII